MMSSEIGSKDSQRKLPHFFPRRRAEQMNILERTDDNQVTFDGLTLDNSSTDKRIA
jgi:hypothetical protein